MKKVYFICSLLLVTASITHAQKKQKNNFQLPAPKLVVGIVVDQMRYDFLYRYQNKYSRGGFKRMMREGFNCQNLHYNYGPTVTAAGHAAIYTGSVPNVNGIVGNEWYDTVNKRTVYCVEDTTVKTIGNDKSGGHMSPRNLLVSTITDQLRIANSFQSKTIGIALKDRGAILPAGHTANGAYWFDSYDGTWISSSYYFNELPAWVKAVNEAKPAAKFFNMKWETLLPIEKYTESDGDDQPYESKLPGESTSAFPHELIGTRGNIYDIIKTTPFGNTLTKDFAIAAIEGENLGMGKNTDFLTVSFSSPDYVGHAFGPNSIEIEDTYLRLDKDIEEMLDYLDLRYGKNNYLVFLSADHGVADIPGFWKKNQLPAGVLEALSVYNKIKVELKQKFGLDDLVLNGDNYQLYLNKELMEKANITIKDVYQALRPFYMTQKGVADFINLHNLDEANIPHVFSEKIRNGFNTKRSGDVMILPQPQWFSGRPTGTTHGTIYNYDSHVPALFFGWGVPAGQTSVRYSISDIAPTIANLLNILEPSGNIGNPIQFNK